MKGVLADATKSVSRAYINNFQDKGKQVAIDVFLVSRVSQGIVLLTGHREISRNKNLYPYSILFMTRSGSHCLRGEVTGTSLILTYCYTDCTSILLQNIYLSLPVPGTLTAE